MSKHTNGRIGIGTPPPNREQTIGTEQGLMLFVATTGAGVPTEANARRLVACWNACEGISTEQLEAAPYKDSAAFMAYLKVEAQRDDLLAALKGMLAIVSDSRGVTGYHLNGDEALWAEFPEVDAARAAIAKAEAGRGEG